MIRHLRWKVVATNMLLISLVLLAVFAAVVLISRSNYRKSVQQQLYQVGTITALQALLLRTPTVQLSTISGAVQA